MIAKPILVWSSGRALRLAAVCCFLLALNSCIPLAVGAAVGYIARDEGMGVAKPLGSGRSVYVDPPTHEEMEEYENGGYDEPVY
jgi:hypothetical protein